MAQLKTTLSILQISLCYGRSATSESGREGLRDVGTAGLEAAGLRTPPSEIYEIRFESSGKPRNDLTNSKLLALLRNALAHCFDDDHKPGSDNVTFPDGAVVSFTDSRRRHEAQTVTFQSADGFVRFVGDYVKAVKSVVGKQLNQAK